MNIKLGIDNGNFNTKTSDHMVYASGFARSNTEFIVPENQLEYNGNYFAIGDHRMNFVQDKANDNDTFILSLPAMANAMRVNGVNEADFVLGVGLPMDIYGTQKKDFKEYFMRGDVSFNYEKENYHASIKDVVVFPQGYAALCRYYKFFADLPSITLVDIGGYTVDVMTMFGKKPDLSGCFSLRHGTIKLFNGIKSQLQSENIILPDNLVEAAIKGDILHARQDVIESIVQKETESYMKSLINGIRERGIDTNLPIAFSGGGAELLSNRLKTGDVNLTCTLDQFANADGYRLLLDR